MINQNEKVSMKQITIFYVILLTVYNCISQKLFAPYQNKLRGDLEPLTMTYVWNLNTTYAFRNCIIKSLFIYSIPSCVGTCGCLKRIFCVDICEYSMLQVFSQFLVLQDICYQYYVFYLLCQYYMGGKQLWKKNRVHYFLPFQHLDTKTGHE